MNFTQYNFSTKIIQTNGSFVFPTNNKPLIHLTTEPLEIYLPSIIATTIFLITVAIIGTIGNSLVVWAFKKQVKQGIISGLFILLLACNDLFISLVVIPCTLYLDIWTGDTSDWICRAHLTMKGFVVPISACILMLIAMERFLLICFIPGIQMKRTHIIISLTIIFWIGLLCAVPMGLHVRAIDAFKERDELLDLNTLKYGLSTLENDEWLNQLRVSKRCDKDDTYINDHLYWYHQICVLILFLALFLGTASVYALIFLFVWRHESFMYEKYGNSNLKGSWVRIHATPNSSVSINLSIRNPIKKRISFRKKINKHNRLQNEQDKQGSNVYEHEKGEQIEQQNYHQRHSGEQSSRLPLSPQQQQQQTLGINPTLIDMTTSTSFVTSNLDRLSCVCLCEGNDNTDDLKNNQCSIPNNQIFNVNTPGNDNELSQCFIHLTGLQVQSDEKIKFTAEHSNPHPSRNEWSAVNLERRRKPHVRTAQTLALVAANFIISYTPYLVYTTMPIQKRQVELLKDKPHWTSQVRRVLFYMYFINSALNPIIYSCMNRHFRASTRKFYSDLKMRFKRRSVKS
ncbi:putative Amine GPCR [Schistosoma japonicum]|uniref:Putative Amine GPCR n=1 Tax=Schistosoma japonicum TaxID=6182 RepID=A0A4Z2DLG5_SCHJA|nr:amine GPCR [Schistosoma japonicum]TNN17331.1 putative Amine GPCR [Schistosoma japonicum]